MVTTAHARIRKFEQSDKMGAYDRWELKLSKQVAPLLKEWEDFLFFCNYQTFIVTSASNTAKMQGGKRVIYTTHHPAWDAKIREPLPDAVDLDYRNIAKLYEKLAPKATAESTGPAQDQATTLDRLLTLMAEANVTETDVQKVVAPKGHYDISVPISEYHEEFIAKWVLRNWNQILKLINASNTHLD